MAWMLGADLFVKALSVFYYAFLSRELAESDMGAYGTFLALLPIFMVLNTGGFQDVITREVAHDRSRRHQLAPTALVLQAVLFVVVLALTFPLLNALGYGPSLRHAVIIACVGGFLWAIIHVHQAIFAAYEDFRPASAANMIVRLLILAGSIAILYLGYGLRELLLFLLPMYGVQAALLAFELYRRGEGFRPDPTAAAAGELAREGWPMALGRLAAATFYRIDLPLLNSLALPGVSDVYAIGFRFWVLLTTIPDTLESLFYPIMSRRAREEPASQHFALVRFEKYMIAVALPMGIGMTILGEQINFALNGERWTESTPAMIILTWVMALAMIDRALVVFLRARGEQRVPFACYGIVLAIKVAAAFPVIANWGMMGLLYLNLATAGVLTVLLFAGTMRSLPLFDLKSLAGILWRPIAATAVMGLIIYALRDYPVFATVPLGAIVYGFVFLGLGGIDSFDRAMIRGRGAGG
jgi:O-antigen/teichoic acid export membrane protein